MPYQSEPCQSIAAPAGADRGPLAYFGFARHYGGSFQSTVRLIQTLRTWTNVAVIDVYGICAQYLADLHRINTPTTLLFPEWRGKATIGGKGLTRNWRLAEALPHLLQLILRLRAALRRLKPRALWVDSEKALFAAALAAPLGTPLVAYIRIQSKRIHPFCIPAWHRANAAFCVYAQGLEFLRPGKYARGNLRVVYDGIDAEQLSIQSEQLKAAIPATPDGRLRLVYPATLLPLKGHTFTIQALAQFLKTGGDAELWLCGDVPLGVPPKVQVAARHLIAELGLGERVHFLGWRDDMPAVIARADAVVLPSFSEGLPLALLEAMALKKPVVATTVGGIPELVRDGVEGRIVNPGDINGLAAALHSLTCHATRARMGAAGYKRVLTDFNREQQARLFLQTIDELQPPLA